MTFSESPPSIPAPFRNLLSQAALGSGAMLQRVLDVARQSMLDDAKHMSGSLARDQLVLCIKLLDMNVRELCENCPKMLTSVFFRPEATQSRFTDLATQGLRLEELELMDEAQVQERVVMARVLQQVLVGTQTELANLDCYMGAQPGVRKRFAALNPLRPDSYVLALHELMMQKSLPPNVRSIWMQHMAAPLGEVLSEFYKLWSLQLKNSNISPIAPLADKLSDSSGSISLPHVPDSRVVWAPKNRHTVLTLGRLRRLLAKELDPAIVVGQKENSDPLVQVPIKNTKESFALQFAKEFEDSTEDLTLASDFDVTLPAAFEALKEMQPVDQDQVMQRIMQSRATTDTSADVLKVDLSLREKLVSEAKGIAQVLSLEVVALMLDNLVQDRRLLEPVRQLIVRLEPALLRLVRVDVRFFSDKQHPARRLLQEIAEQGLAFGEASDPLFKVYLESLNRYVLPLSQLTIEGCQPFATALASLRLDWELNGIRERASLEKDDAKAALKFAEQRNILANKIAEDMRSNIELKKMPQSIVDFLIGPWAQVMATAQLTKKKGDADLSGYKTLVGMLLWSAQPELTCKDINRLTQLMPRLLMGLRSGLHLIDYPSIKTSLFFDVLMKLHQQAFNQKLEVAAQSSSSAVQSSLVSDEDGWIAPQEAKVSGFLALDNVLAGETDVPVQVRRAVKPRASVEQEPVVSALSEGCWVELQVNGSWSRTQLTWISPQKTMYLFTNIRGSAQSMTKRMLVRLSNAGAFRVLSDQPVVDDALDAVVHTAMINSLDLKLD